MRSLLEIVESARCGEQTTHEECLYAMLALNSLSLFASRDIERLVEVAEGRRKFPPASRIHERRYERNKKAFSISPKKYLGWNYDPKNPESVKASKAGIAFAKEIFERK